MSNLISLSALVASGLPEDKAVALTEKFADYTVLADEWNTRARAIIVSDETDTAGMKMAREGRLLLKGKRVALEHLRKSLKEASLKEGRAIDDIARTLTGLLEPTERYLESQEKFAERAAADRAAIRRAARIEALAPYDVIPDHYDLVGMSEAAFAELLTGITLATAQREAAARVAEEARVREAEARAIQVAELAAQHATERAAAERENAELRRKQAEATAALGKERAEKTRLANELREREEAQAAQRAREEAAERAAENAPDCEKLLAFAALLDELTLPEMANDAAGVVINNTRGLLVKVSTYLRQNAQALGAVGKEVFRG